MLLIRSIERCLPSNSHVVVMASASTRRLLLLRPMSHNRLSAHLLRRSIHLRQPTPLRLLHLHCIRLAADASTAPTDSSASALSSASSPSLPPPVSASSPSASVRRQPRPPSSSSSSSSSYSSTDVLGIAFFLGLSAFTLYLGSWQLHRKQWKEKSAQQSHLRGAAPADTSLIAAHPLAVRCCHWMLQTGGRTNRGAQGDSSRPHLAAAATVSHQLVCSLSVHQPRCDLTSPERPLCVSVLCCSGNDWHAVPEFQRVSVSGVFEYSGQMKVGLRSAPVTKTGLSGQGYFVITPMSVDG